MSRLVDGLSDISVDEADGPRLALEESPRVIRLLWRAYSVLCEREAFLSRLLLLASNMCSVPT
jgi:hypothetical protein